MKLLGILLAAVPFAFAGIRLATTRTDARYLWMAVGSTLCAAVVLVRPGRAGPDRRRLGAAVVAASLGAAAIALVVRATAVSGVVIVGLSFGLCSAIGIGLVVGSPRRSGE